MEGMGGGPAAAQGDAGVADGGAAQNGQNGDGGSQFDAVLADLAEMAEGQELMRQQLAGLPEQLRGLPLGDHPLPEGDGDPSEFDGGGDLDALGLEDAGGDPGDAFDAGDPAADAAALAGALDGFVAAQTEPLREGLQQLQSAHENLQWQHDVSELVAEFPEMGEKETAVSVWLATARAAHAMGQPELAASVHLARMAYLAGRALEAAQDEPQDAGPPAAYLESGAGSAGPGGGGQSAAQAILGAGRSSVLPFS